MHRASLVWPILSCSVLALLSSNALGIERSSFRIDSLSGAGWQGRQLQLDVRFVDERIQTTVQLARLQLTGVNEALSQVRIDCADTQLLENEFACADARITGVFPYLGTQTLRASARYLRSSGAIHVQVRQLQLAQGEAQLSAQLHDKAWQSELTTHNMELSDLLQLAGKLLSTPNQRTPNQQAADLSGSGRVDAHITASGIANTPATAQWQLQLRDLSINNPAGTLATDKLNLHSSGQLQRHAAAWQINAEVSAAQGQAYGEPVFIDFSAYPATLTATALLTDDRLLHLQDLRIAQSKIVAASAQGTIELEPVAGLQTLVQTVKIPALQINIEQLQFPGSFATYLQPFLLDSSFKNLNTDGTLSGVINIENNLPVSADLQLQSLRADDGTANLRIEQLQGDIHWRNMIAAATEPPRSQLQWSSGSLLGMELGATTLVLELWDTNLRVAEPTRIPVFNGALAIDAFRVRRAGTPQMAFMLDATIEPINVAQISRAFGWPEFGGELSGKITKLRMEDGVLTLGASLAAQVFAGEVSISNLKLEGALTQWPRFTADIGLQRLDLEQVTQAFSFGRITGRLSGEINDLELFNWQPVAFDARLYTPADDRSRHRISQRAVQNIGSVGGSGGGVTAALQSGFLKFFDEFNYDRLGLSCRLINEVCLMNGVAPAKNGAYYLVKGKGLPRIDVLGNATRIDWPRLVAQLQAITESAGPVIK